MFAPANAILPRDVSSSYKLCSRQKRRSFRGDMEENRRGSPCEALPDRIAIRSSRLGNSSRRWTPNRQLQDLDDPGKEMRCCLAAHRRSPCRSSRSVYRPSFLLCSQESWQCARHGPSLNISPRRIGRPHGPSLPRGISTGATSSGTTSPVSVRKDRSRALQFKGLLCKFLGLHPGQWRWF